MTTIPFKIPKKTQTSEQDSVQMLSPLSRIQDDSTFKTSNWSRSNSTHAHKSCLLRGPGFKAERDRWRPKKASDKLCQDENQESGCLSLWKSHRAGLNAWKTSPDPPASAQASPSDTDQDYDEEMFPEKASACQPGSTYPAESLGMGIGLGGESRSPPSPRIIRKVRPKSLQGVSWKNHDSGRAGSLSHNFEKEKRCMEAATSASVPPVDSPTSRASPASEDPPPLPSTYSSKSRQQGRPFLRRIYSQGRPTLNDEPMQREREMSRLSLHRTPRPKQTSSEPIVLSSEDEVGQEDDDRTSFSLSSTLRTRPGRSSPRQNQFGPEEQVGVGDATCPKPADGSPQQQPAIMELPFVTLQAGVLRAEANGVITVTDDGITLPLKDPGSEEEGEGISVSLVASQLRSYGLWNGELARKGTLLCDWEGPAPSLLFLRVSDAQAGLLQTELSAICPVTELVPNTTLEPVTNPALDLVTKPAPACVFLFLVLQEILSDIQASLLTSMRAFRQGCSSPPPSQLSYVEGRALIQGWPPVEQLLGPSTLATTRQDNTTGQKGSAGPRASLQSREDFSLLRLSSRLVYPSLTSKGGITVTMEDLVCLESGEFLNDIIIDFYLKYLLLERVDSQVAERCHVFSSFFFRQLTRCAGGEDPSIPSPDRRHQRVKTWTRHVDIFNKDFLFIPVNQNAHWYLVVICFPGLEEAQQHPRSGPVSTPGPGLERECAGRGGADRGKPAMSTLSLRSSRNTPDCTQHGCQRETVCRRPCILSMDSLKLSTHNTIFKLLRDYLQVEWSVRRGTPRRFTADTMKGSHCCVPVQDNSSDCGLYLLQYVETFLQNPVVHFDDLPLRLERWFPRQKVWRKREDIKRLIMQLYDRQGNSQPAW